MGFQMIDAIIKLLTSELRENHSAASMMSMAPFPTCSALALKSHLHRAKSFQRYDERQRAARRESELA